MLDVFYGAFSPACFALLGLWLVIVQIRLREWQGSAVHRRRSYAVALYFALPGIMSLLALVNPHDSAFWRISSYTGYHHGGRVLCRQPSPCSTAGLH